MRRDRAGVGLARSAVELAREMESRRRVRDAAMQDMAAVQRIYAGYVTGSVATLEEIAPEVEELIARRESVVAAGLPYLVAGVDGQIAGFAYASPYRARGAYRYTVEDSVYVAASMHRRGIGSALLQELISRCAVSGRKQMIAVIGGSDNAGSIALHRRFGFREAGILEAVGWKHNGWVDTVLMQRALGAE